MTTRKKIFIVIGILLLIKAVHSAQKYAAETRASASQKQPSQYPDLELAVTKAKEAYEEAQKLPSGDPRISAARKDYENAMDTAPKP